MKKSKSAVLRSAKIISRGHVSAVVKAYDPMEHESPDGVFRLVNYGLNDCFTKEQLQYFALGILEMTGALETELYLEDK